MEHLRSIDKNDMVSDLNELGIETSSPKEEVENPKTGINFRYGLLLLISVLSIISYISIRRKSKFPKHN